MDSTPSVEKTAGQSENQNDNQADNNTKPDAKTSTAAKPMAKPKGDANADNSKTTSEAKKSETKPAPVQKKTANPNEKSKPTEEPADKTETEKKPAEAKVDSGAADSPVSATAKAGKAVAKPKEPSKRWLGKALFFLLVIIPTVLTAFYYYFISSDQFQSEMRFSVRGTNTSPLDSLGLNALPGNTAQAADAYIVIDYITSPQVLIDINEQLGVDVRSYFSKEEIDPIYRVDPQMPWEEFIFYWNWMIDASFNSTTGITSFRVNAFSGEDATTITRLVLDVAKVLVNNLSVEARTQLIKTAQAEVLRTEQRMFDSRRRITEFRDKEQSLNPTLQAESDQELIQGLQKELIDLKSRRAALTASVNENSPTVRVIDRQIEAVANELESQRQVIGSGIAGNLESSRNLSELLNEYTGLELEQEFSEKAYTAALSSLEQAQTEARKQERYFAIVLNPTEPAVALFPLRVINTIIAFGAFFVIWLLVYLVVQAVREHTV